MFLEINKTPGRFSAWGKNRSTAGISSVQHTTELFSFGEDKSHVVTFGVANSARGVAG